MSGNMNVLACLGLIGLMSLLVAIVLLARKDILNLGIIVKQITSGRWLLTVTAGLCMIIATITDAWIAIKSIGLDNSPEMPFPVSTIFTLAGVVFTSYFNKKETESVIDPEKK